MKGHQLNWARRWLLAIATLVFCIASQQSTADLQTAPASSSVAETPVTLNGTGASFPLFFYERLFNDYRQTVDPNVMVNYQPTGSAAGIQQMISQTVDFGASDIAMTDEEMAQVERGIVLVPMTAGTVAIAYNLPGIEQGLRLPRTVLVDLFLGKISRWSDPAIAAANPDLALPDLPVTVVHRSDGSGTTAAFTAHLSAISDTWKTQVGNGLNVNWPSGIGIKANAGVSAQIQQAEGTIGYVEYGYAQKLGLSVAAVENRAGQFVDAVENRAGQFVDPSPANGAKDLETVDMPDNLRVFVPDPVALAAYPIVTYSWILAYQTYPDATQGEALKAVLKWGLSTGQHLSKSLGYIPLSESVVEKAMLAVEQIQIS